jgi:hypothetical protein
MKSILAHCYARFPQTKVYSAPGSDDFGIVQKGSWMGVRSTQEEWLHITTAQFDGWVKKEDVMPGKHLDLTILLPGMSSQGGIAYTLAS